MALLKGLLVVILLLGIVLLISRYIEVPQTHLAAITHHKSEPLTNDNIVDVLSQYIDTTTLSSIRVQRGLLDVEIAIKPGESIDEQLYQIVPMYIALAFYYGNNIDQLAMKVMREEGMHRKQLRLLELTVHRDDAWLEQGVELLKEINWLGDKNWNEILRIQKSVFWQLNYEV